jgi:hypothetical protein
MGENGVNGDDGSDGRRTTDDYDDVVRWSGGSLLIVILDRTFATVFLLTAAHRCVVILERLAKDGRAKYWGGYGVTREPLEQMFGNCETWSIGNLRLWNTKLWNLETWNLETWNRGNLKLWNIGQNSLSKSSLAWQLKSSHNLRFRVPWSFGSQYRVQLFDCNFGLNLRVQISVYTFVS